jgi:hypothetical protein
MSRMCLFYLLLLVSITCGLVGMELAPENASIYSLRRAIALLLEHIDRHATTIVAE